MNLCNILAVTISFLNQVSLNLSADEVIRNKKTIDDSSFETRNIEKLLKIYDSINYGEFMPSPGCIIPFRHYDTKNRFKGSINCLLMNSNWMCYKKEIFFENDIDSFKHLSDCYKKGRSLPTSNITKYKTNRNCAPLTIFGKVYYKGCFELGGKVICRSKITSGDFLNCVIDGYWTEWQDYGACSHTCGTGVRYRKRSCHFEEENIKGAKCPGSSNKTEPCFDRACPTWGSWKCTGECSRQCYDEGGKQNQTRVCRHPVPGNGLNQCPGSATKLGDCCCEEQLKKFERDNHLILAVCSFISVIYASIHVILVLYITNNLSPQRFTKTFNMVSSYLRPIKLSTDKTAPQ